jgi:hypothetical protein
MSGDRDGAVSAQFFPYRFDRRFAPIWGALGARPGRDGVRVTDDELEASYGHFSFSTPLHNVAGGHITERYRWYTAVGVRLSFADDGLTFGTNRDRGVCIHFHEPIPKVVGRRDHSAVTVTVEDCEGLVAAIGEAR